MVPNRNTPLAMNHPQPENGNPLKSVSKAGVGIVRSFMKPKCSKSWDMKYHWLEDCTKMGHLNTYRERGIHNWEVQVSLEGTPHDEQVSARHTVCEGELITL